MTAGGERAARSARHHLSLSATVDGRQLLFMTAGFMKNQPVILPQKAGLTRSIGEREGSVIFIKSCFIEGSRMSKADVPFQKEKH